MEALTLFIKVLVVLGGLVAALGVAVMCGICLLVWVAGLGAPKRTEAWPPPDKP